MRNNTAIRLLRTKEITDFIEYLVTEKNESFFFSLSESDKNYLTALGIKALGTDIEIILSENANSILFDFLSSNDDDNRIELLRSVRESAHEFFSAYFDEMLYEAHHYIEDEKMEATGFYTETDTNNGETTWKKSA